MTAVIDDLTGLPELPEGQWWEVVEREDDSWDYRNSTIAWGYGAKRQHYAVTICKEVQVPGSVKTEPGRWPWSRPIEHVTPARVGKSVLGTRPIYDFDLKEPEEPKLTAVDPVGDFCYPQYAGKITPEGVRRAAERLLLQQENDRAYKAKQAAEKALTESLLGAYPPKRLVVEKPKKSAKR